MDALEPEEDLEWHTIGAGARRGEKAEHGIVSVDSPGIGDLYGIAGPRTRDVGKLGEVWARARLGRVE